MQRQNEEPFSTWVHRESNAYGAQMTHNEQGYKMSEQEMSEQEMSKQEIAEMRCTGLLHEGDANLKDQDMQRELSEGLRHRVLKADIIRSVCIKARANRNRRTERVPLARFQADATTVLKDMVHPATRPADIHSDFARVSIESLAERHAPAGAAAQARGGDAEDVLRISFAGMKDGKSRAKFQQNQMVRNRLPRDPDSDLYDDALSGDRRPTPGQGSTPEGGLTRNRYEASARGSLSGRKSQVGRYY